MRETLIYEMFRNWNDTLSWEEQFSGTESVARLTDRLVQIAPETGAYLNEVSQLFHPSIGFETISNHRCRQIHLIQTGNKTSTEKTTRDYSRSRILGIPIRCCMGLLPLEETAG